MKLVQILFTAIGITMGLFVFLRSQLTIEIQRKFYEKINWRMEPIDMAKEIKNTKLMGFFLFSVCVFALFFLIRLAAR